MASTTFLSAGAEGMVDWVLFQTNEPSVLAGVVRFADRDTNVLVQKVYRTRKLAR